MARPRKATAAAVKHAGDAARLETRIDNLHDHMHAMNRKLEALHDDLTKYKGMWGGLLLAFGAIAAAGKLALAYFFSKR